MAPRASFVETTSFFMYLNVATGMWGINIDNIVSSVFAKHAFLCFAVVTDAIVVLHGLSSFVRVMAVDASKFEVSVGFLAIGSLFQTSAKCIYFALRRKQFQRYCNTWDTAFPLSPLMTDKRKSYNGEERKVKAIAIGLLVMFVMAGVPWTLSPFLPAMQEIQGGRFLSMPLWLPFDALKSPAYEMIVVLQAFTSIFNLTKTVAFDSLFFTFVSLEIVEFKHLSVTIQKLFKENNDVISESSPDAIKRTAWKAKAERRQPDYNRNRQKFNFQAKSLNGRNRQLTAAKRNKIVLIADSFEVFIEKRTTRMKGQLAQWIKHHQDVLELGEQLRALYFPMIMVQFVSATVIFCFTAFIIASVNLAVVQKVVCALFSCGTTLQLVLLCHFGDRLETESVALSDACFASDWHWLKSKEVHRSFKVILLRSQKPLRITFFGLYPLNKKTFVDVMQASISYFMILLRLNAKLRI